MYRFFFYEPQRITILSIRVDINDDIDLLQSSLDMKNIDDYDTTELTKEQKKIRNENPNRFIEKDGIVYKVLYFA